MKGLSKDEKTFLKSQKIKIDDLFNAKGQTISTVRAEMKELEKNIAYNSTPCNKGGHTIRTRGGHCAQCNTARIGFQSRHSKPGITYVAIGSDPNIIKIGFSGKAEKREWSLKYTEYGSIKDWKIVFAVESNQAAILESKTQFELKKHAFSAPYIHEKKQQMTNELFQCSFQDAKNALLKVVKTENIDYTLIIDRFSELK